MKNELSTIYCEFATCCLVILLNQWGMGGHATRLNSHLAGFLTNLTPALSIRFPKTKGIHIFPRRLHRRISKLSPTNHITHVQGAACRTPSRFPTLRPNSRHPDPANLQRCLQPECVWNSAATLHSATHIILPGGTPASPPHTLCAFFPIKYKETPWTLHFRTQSRVLIWFYLQKHKDSASCSI